MLKAGSAQVDITPDRGVMLAGSFQARWATEVCSRLCASAVSVDDGTTKLVLVSCDLLFLTDEICGQLREDVARSTGTTPASVVIACTHTHNAPGLFRCLPDLPVDEDVAAAIGEKILDAAVKASERSAPARMGYARGQAELTFNRRCMLANGKVRMGPGPQDPPVVRLEGPQDQEFQVMWFETLPGRKICVLVNYSSHSTLMFGDCRISADYPGEARRVVQDSLGNDVPILYLQGACGNTSPIDFLHPGRVRRGFDRAREVGEILAGRILEAMSAAGKEVVESAEIAQGSSGFEAPARHRGPEDLPLHEARDYLLAHPLGRINHACEPEMRPRYFARSVVELEGADPFRDSYPVEVSAYRIGDVAVVANPAELFVEYQLEIKEKSPFSRTLVVELCNGYCGYVLTQRALEAGSYEARLAFSSKLAPASGRMIVEETLRLLGRLQRTSGGR